MTDILRPLWSSGAGCGVVEMPGARAGVEHLPRGVLVENAVVWVNGCTPSLAIVTNPGNEVRKPECQSDFQSRGSSKVVAPRTASAANRIPRDA